jgi:3-(3-hydroxy-phenyl)propionate hydroxylase
VSRAELPGGELWRQLRPRLVEVLLDDRFPAEGGTPTVADFDGGLRESLRAAAGQYVLVRPDRYVAAVFAGAEASAVAARLVRAWGRPAPTPVLAGTIA